MKSGLDIKPSHQEAVNLFKGEWLSRFPQAAGIQTGGSAGLFEDDRITWAWNRIGHPGDEILELGPLEAGHSYMLEKLGAGSVLGIESNPNAYLKCLIAKEALELNRCHFLYGDFLEFLRCDNRKWDTVIACGVLYHVPEPVELLHLLSTRTRKLFLWTHYYDEEYQKRPHVNAGLPFEIERCLYDNINYKKYKRGYGEAAKTKSFCGGSESVWLEVDTIFKFIKKFSFKIIDSRIEDNPLGRAVNVAACIE